MRKKILVFIFSSLFVSFVYGKIPDKVMKVINKAGNNKSEFFRAINYFEKQKDNRKLEALYFLIRNMEDKSYIKYSVVDKNGNPINFNPLIYKNYKEMSKVWFKLVKERGAHHIKSEEIKDINTITADLLIENIELAFKAREEKPWASSYDFKEFLEYILPYRGSNEPLEHWRKYFFNRYVKLEKQMKDRTDPVEATIMINSSLMKWFRFDDIYYEHPTDQGLKEMLKSKRGRCEDMTNLAIYALRANGVAVVTDFTPFWAVSNNNHAWNAVITRNKKVVPFMGGEKNPYDYGITNRVAKVYRKTFSINHNSLPFKIGADKIPNRYLKVKSMVDVTPSYTTVSNLSIKTKNNINNKYAYLCVFNTGNWEAVGYGKIEKGFAKFNNVGNNNIVYIIFLFNKKKLIPVTSPFILKSDGSMHFLIPDKSHREDVLINSITKRTIKDATVVSQKGKIENKSGYDLFYFDGKWIKVENSELTENGLIFKNVPENSLLWLVKRDGRKDERIFIYKNNKQIFY